MDPLKPSGHQDAFGQRINRDHHPVLARVVPWATIMLASIAPLSPVIAPAPVLPPLAFLLLIAWQQLRPDVLPLWAGFPLGLFDDLYSGQPFGSGIVLFSIAVIVLNLIEIRFPWRNFWLDWLTASAMLIVYLAAAAVLSGSELTFVQLRVILPQLLLSIVLFPLVARLVAQLDRLRLMRVRRIG
jgi:rod shape-determining protein MreD